MKLALLMTVSLFNFVACNERQKDSFSYNRSEKFEFFAMSMPGEMRNDVAAVTAKAIQYFTQPTDIASYLKDAFDKAYDSPWQCSVSTKPIGYANRYNENYYMYYRMYNYYVLLYRTKALSGYAKHPVKRYSTEITPDLDIDGGRVQLINVDMTGYMKNDAIDIAISAVQAFVKPQNIADFIKNDFAERYGDYWQCHVFRRMDFGSAITTSRGSFIFFRIDEYFVVLYRTITNF